MAQFYRAGGEGILHPSWEIPHSAPILGLHEVHVWRIPLLLNSSDPGPWLTLLCTEEKRRALRLKPEARWLYIISHAALQLCAGLYLFQQPPFAWSYSKKGKPFLEGSTLKFSLSHSGDWALIALSQKIEVGVDVERLAFKADCDRLARRYFTASEADRVASQQGAGKLEVFFGIWTRREALVKAKGKGLFDGDRDEGGCRLVSFEVDAGHAGALAALGEGDVRLCFFEGRNLKK